MEDYDLRSSYLPDLNGLHVRIHQFKELLRLHLPALSSHLDDLQVDPAYVSQWFLSFFAVTCPLPMLFRIYDVVFAEGASETIMRVAMSLMQKNQGRILACTEMEDVMQLLLSRGLWDCYHYNADEFVRDFTSLSHVVSRERLAALEQGYREAQIANLQSTTNARSSDVTTAASRFLGRLWSSNSNPTNNPSKASISSSTLSPGLPGPLRPLSMLRRSTSKQSIASTLNSGEAASSSASILSLATTEATSVSRDSSDSTVKAVGTSNSSSNKNADSRHLHTQIEDLLTALSDLQRQHALLSEQLQREHEGRAEDRKAVRSLLDGLRQKAGSGRPTDTDTAQSANSEDTIKGPDGEDEQDAAAPGDAAEKDDTAEEIADNLPSAEKLSQLLDNVESRFGVNADKRRSSISQTKTQLFDELKRAKEELAGERQTSGRRIVELTQEMTSVKDQLRESHSHVRTLHQDKQRLEKQVQELRARASDQPTTAAMAANMAYSVAVETASDWFGRTNPAPTGSSPGKGGLRELKLGRSKSTPTPANPMSRRASSLMMQPAATPVNENDALLLELVQSKTAEAIAKQEAEEAKQKLESFRKAMGLAAGETPPTNSNAATTAMGMLNRAFTSSSAEGLTKSGQANPTSAPAATGSTPAASGYTGFFGWRR